MSPPDSAEKGTYPEVKKHKASRRVKSFHGSNKVVWILAQMSLSSEESNITDSFIENPFP